MKKFKREKNEKRWFIIFTAASIVAAVFELFHAAGLAITKDYMRPYALWIAILGLLFAVSVIFASRRAYLVSLILTVTGSVGLSAIGYALANPVKLAEEYYVDGLGMGVFWKYFAPTLLLIIPALALFVIGLKRKKREENEKPYEKQF